MKQTEIGLIPDDWEVKNINKECTIKARIGWQGLKSTEYLDYGNYILITGTDFNNGFINWKSCSYVTKWRYNQDKNIQIKQGDVLVTKDGTIGKIAFLGSIPMQGTLNSGVFVVRPKNNEKIDSVFLSLIFKSLWFDSFLEQITSGSTIVHLYQKDFVKFDFPLPPLAEQQRIAKALSDVDALIFTTEKLLQKKRNIKQGTMQKLLTGKKRLPGFAKSNNTKMTELGEIPEDWEVKSVSSLLKIGHGKDYKNLKEGAVPVFGTGGYMTSVNDYLYDGDTVCIGRKGTIDKPFFHTGKIWTVDTLFYTYDFVNCIPKFIYYAFCLVDWLSMNEASGVPSLTSKNIEDVFLCIPSNVSEQTAIVNVLSDMDAEIEKLSAKLQKYHQLKTAMMQQLLTGKIRL